VIVFGRDRAVTAVSVLVSIHLDGSAKRCLVVDTSNLKLPKWKAIYGKSCSPVPRVLVVRQRHVFGLWVAAIVTPLLSFGLTVIVHRCWVIQLRQEFNVRVVDGLEGLGGMYRDLLSALRC